MTPEPPKRVSVTPEPPRRVDVTPEPPRRADVTPEPPARATVDSRNAMDTVPVYEAFTGTLAADFYAESTSRLAVLIAQVVRLEGPIHEELLRTRIARAYGLKRAGATIQGQVKIATSFALRKELILVRGAFLWPPGENAVRLPRRPAPGTDARKIAHIAAEEVEAAVVVALEMWGRMVLEPLTKGVTSILGYERIGHDVRSAVEAAIARLERSGRITHGAAGYQVNQ